MPEAATAKDALRQRRRAEILDAALTLVAEEGLDALTIGALERRLAFTRGVISYHFRNKDEIVLAVFERAIDEIDTVAMDRIMSTTGTEARARAVVRHMVGAWLGHPAAGPVLLSFWGRLRVDPSAAEVNAALYRRYRKYSARLITDAIEAGELSAEVDPESMAAVLVALVLGIGTQAMFEQGAIDVERVVEVAGDAVVAHLKTYAV